MNTLSTPAYRRPLLVCVSLVALLLVCNQHAIAQAVSPAELVVDPNGGTAFSTLSGALAAASPGTIIRLRSGTYDGNILIDKNISLVGYDPDQTAVIDGQDQQSLFKVAGSITCRLENLVFRRGIGHSGAALNVSQGALVDVINCSFHDNTARHRGGAILATDPGTWVEFVGCHFQHNKAHQDAGALGIFDGAEATLRACVFYANGSQGACGGIAHYSEAHLTVEQCLFIENLGSECAAIIIDESPAHISGNTFFQNTSLGGATVMINQASEGLDIEVTNNIFTSDFEGAGLAIPTSVYRGCNIYYANFGGPLLAGEIIEGEVIADPGFCDFIGQDLSLRRNSPACSDHSTCGRIGALEIGCLEPMSATRGEPLSPRRLVR